MVRVPTCARRRRTPGCSSRRSWIASASSPTEGSAVSGSPDSWASPATPSGAYLAGAPVGHQERPQARRLDAAALREVQDLYSTVAEGNAVVVQQELAARSAAIKLRTLQRAVAPLRQERRAEALATVRFETPPGQQLQIDFGEKVVRIAGRPVKVYLMTAVLGYSRRLHVRASLAQRQDDWLEGLDEAFRHFGGLTEQVLCDNASPLVISHDRRTGHVAWNPGFEAFCRDRGLTAVACRPRRARTKGKIERGVGYVKHNALAGRSFASFEALQDHLARWMAEVADQRVHGTTRERPADRFERGEQRALRPSPSRPLAVRTRRLRRRGEQRLLRRCQHGPLQRPFPPCPRDRRGAGRRRARRDLPARGLHRAACPVLRAARDGPHPGPLRGAVSAGGRGAGRRRGARR